MSIYTHSCKKNIYNRPFRLKGTKPEEHHRRFLCPPCEFCNTPKTWKTTNFVKSYTFLNKQACDDCWEEHKDCYYECNTCECLVCPSDRKEKADMIHKYWKDREAEIKIDCSYCEEAFSEKLLTKHTNEAGMDCWGCKECYSHFCGDKDTK